MAQLNLSHTLTAGTPENINDVQDNFQDIVDHVNDALIGDDNLTSPNNSVARTVFEVGGTQLGGSWATGTYIFKEGATPVLPTQANSGAKVWIPNTTDAAVSGKTTQVRLVSYIITNATAPAANITIGLQRASASAGASGAVSLTLAAAAATVVFTTPSASDPGTRSASSWVSLSGLTAGAYCLTVAASTTTAASSVVLLTASVEMRHT